MSEEYLESSETTLTSEKPEKEFEAELQDVVVREYPKTVLLYPMILTSLILAVAALLVSLFILDPILQTTWLFTIGFIWFVLFFFNLLIVTFEFGKSVSVAIALILVIIVLVVVLILTQYGIGPLTGINPAALRLFISVEAYLAFFLLFSFLLFLSWIKTRIYYFKITPNEIIYKKGIMGDVERYGTSNVMVHKEIPDVFEFLLLRSGRLSFNVPGRKAPIILDNVPRINTIEVKILYLLRRIEVDID